MRPAPGSSSPHPRPAGPHHESSHFGEGRRQLYLVPEFAVHAAAIFSALARPAAEREAGAGNRRSGFALQPAGLPELFVRYGRRGGFFGSVLRDVYFGLGARPLRELTVACEARRRGLTVAEPVGVLIEALGPWMYRSAFLTRRLTGMTLWEFLGVDDDGRVRRNVLGKARAAIDLMHRGGLFHADLNLHNLFVTTRGEDFTVVILDLDKARLFTPPLPPRYRKNNFARLRRSIKKLGPAGVTLDRAAALLLAGG